MALANFCLYVLAGLYVTAAILILPVCFLILMFRDGLGAMGMH